MSQYNGNGTASSTNIYPSFPELIEEYLDPTPKEKGKHFCPVCAGHNLSLGKNGKWDCFDDPSKEHRQDICTWLNDRYRQDHPELSNGNGRSQNKAIRPKSARVKHQEALKEASAEAFYSIVEIESKIEELAHQFDPAYGMTLAKLTAEIASWAKSLGHDVFAAKMMLKERIERAATAAATGGNAVVITSGNGQNPYGSKDVGVDYGVSAKRDIDELLESLKEMRGIEAVKSDRLDPYKLFPYELANALERAAAVLPCPVEALITALLSVCSTLVGTSSRVFMSQSWDECLVFWGMISGPTGSMKSTTLSLITKPLIRMQAQAEFRYIQAMDQWSLSKRDAEKNKEEFDD